MVYLLRHIYNFLDENNKVQIEDKILGVYSTVEKAEEAIERYSKLPGFCDYPKACFVIEQRSVNKDTAWNKGFDHSKISGVCVRAGIENINAISDETAKEYAFRMLCHDDLNEADLKFGLLEEYMNLVLYGELHYDLNCTEREGVL